MNLLKTSLLLIVLKLCTQAIIAHSNTDNVHYLGNAGVMVVGQSNKILFDPFFHNHNGQYTLVPEVIRQRIFNNNEPYKDIDAIFISHIHDDHFAAGDLSNYLAKHSHVKLFVPAEARRQLVRLDKYVDIENRITYVDVNMGQAPVTITLPSLTVEAVFIPHSGWPKMTVQNVVFRVTSPNDFTVMHLGDVGSKNSYFETHKVFWNNRRTHLALVPFWLGLSQPGYKIIDRLINANHVLGVHVPQAGHPALSESGLDYFLTPGETRSLATDGQ